MNRRLGAPQSQSGYCREEKPSCTCWALQHDTSVFHRDSLVSVPAFAVWTETVMLPSFIRDLKASNKQERRINKIIPSVIRSRDFWIIVSSDMKFTCKWLTSLSDTGQQWPWTLLCSEMWQCFGGTSCFHLQCRGMETLRSMTNQTNMVPECPPLWELLHSECAVWPRGTVRCWPNRSEQRSWYITLTEQQAAVTLCVWQYWQGLTLLTAQQKLSVPLL
jgi:hypothetical protein